MVFPYKTPIPDAHAWLLVDTTTLANKVHEIMLCRGIDDIVLLLSTYETSVNTYTGLFEEIQANICHVLMSPFI